MFRTFLALAGMFIATNALASGKFLIKSELSWGGETLGSPAMAVESGKPAQVSVGDEYELTFLATQQGSGAVLVATEISVAGRRNAPSLLVNLDQPASVSIGEMKLDLVVSRLP